MAYFLLALAAVVPALLAYASTRPDEFRVERRLRFAVPAAQLWPLIGELRGFNRWNLCERGDPLIKGQYAGTASGIGSRYSWQSDQVGTGSLEITGQQPGNAVQMKLDFVKLFEARHQAEFAMQPMRDGATEVSWRMHGPANFISKLMGVFIDMDSMVGRDFEDGLPSPRRLAEAKS